MTAKKAGVQSTGHSSSVPLCLAMVGGTEFYEELIIKSPCPTLEVTYLNYPAMPNPQEAVFTATTRHGTFIVEDGQYKAYCPPLRLRMKSFEALSRIVAMTKSRIVRGQENYGMFYPISLVVPAMRIEGVDFVGSNPKI